MFEFFLNRVFRRCPKVIDDEHLLHVRAKNVTKRLMFRVRQVNGPAIIVLEGEQEAVCEAVVEAFRAVVGATSKISDGLDLGG